MFEAGQAGDHEKARTIQEMINAIRDVMYEAGPTLVAVVGMLELQGVCRTFPRAPFLPLDASAVEPVRQKLIQMRVL